MTNENNFLKKEMDAMGLSKEQRDAIMHNQKVNGGMNMTNENDFFDRLGVPKEKRDVIRAVAS
jgi:hypothetical protein